MEPFLTIIIPVYKIREDYLYQCLNSLAEQTESAFRAILIDDGSPDNCGQICDVYAQKDHRFSVIHQENKGVSEARNAALQMVKTEWVTFADADDWLETNLVEALHKGCNEYEADIYIYDYFNELHGQSIRKQLKQDAGILNEKWKKQIRLAPFHFLSMDGKKLPYVAHAVWNKMFRTSLLKKNHILFERMAKRGEDSLFLAQALLCAEQICYLNVPLYHYRRQRESATNIFNQNILQDNRILFQGKEKLISKFNLSEDYMEALDANICTSLYSSMRLWYFNQRNTTDKGTRKRDVRRILDTEPYKAALRRVRYQDLTAEQKIFVWLLKYHQITLVALLVWLRRKIMRMG